MYAATKDAFHASCCLAVSNARVALTNFYNIAIRIANVAARLAVLRLYLRLFWHDRRFRIRSRRLRTATTTRSAAAASICSSRRRLSRSSVMRMREFPSIEGKGILLQAAGLRAACASRKASSSRSHNAWSSPSGSGRQSRNFDEPGGNGFLGRHSAMGDRPLGRRNLMAVIMRCRFGLQWLVPVVGGAACSRARRPR